MGVTLPSHGRHGLNGHGWDTVWKDRESVLLGLGIEDLETWDGDDLGLDSLLGKLLDGIDTDSDLGTSGNENDVGVLIVVDGVTTLHGRLKSGVLELWKVLAGEGDDGWSMLRGESDVVSGGGLVSVSWAPDHAVWKSTEVGEGLNWLMGWSILTKSDGIVSSDPDGADLGKGGETNGTGSIGDEVKESASVWDDGSICGETVHDGAHGVLTYTVSDVASGPVTEAGGWWLEVSGVLPARQIGAGEISRSTDQLWNNLVDVLENDLGELAGGNSVIRWAIDWELLLPSLWELAGQAALEVLGLGWELLGVLLKELVPLLLSGGTLGGVLVVKVVNGLVNSKGLLWVEAELLLDLSNIILLQWSAVNTAGTLKKGAESDGSAELDHRWLISDLLALLDGGLNGLEVVVSVADGDAVPSVCLHALVDILSEGAVGVSVNGDSVVIIDGNQVAELQVAGERSSLRGDTLHVASISHEDVCVVVDELETWLVKLGTGLALSNGKTNSVGETLSKWTGGDLDTWSIVGFRVTWSSGVDVLKGLLGWFLAGCPIFAYSEVLEVIHGQVVTSQVEEGILEHASVSVA